jgi:hypothetical protein
MSFKTFHLSLQPKYLFGYECDNITKIDTAHACFTDGPSKQLLGIAMPVLVEHEDGVLIKKYRK